MSVTYRTVVNFVNRVGLLPDERQRAFALLFTADIGDAAPVVFKTFDQAARLSEMMELLDIAGDIGIERVDEIRRAFIAWTQRGAGDATLPRRTR